MHLVINEYEQFNHTHVPTRYFQAYESRFTPSQVESLSVKISVQTMARAQTFGLKKYIK